MSSTEGEWGRIDLPPDDDLAADRVVVAVAVVVVVVRRRTARRRGDGLPTSVAGVREPVQVEQQAVPVDREGRGARGEDDAAIALAAAAAAVAVEAESTEERAQTVHAHNFFL